MAKILVADDEELIRRLIGDCLKKEGLTDVTCGTVEGMEVGQEYRAFPV